MTHETGGQNEGVITSYAQAPARSITAGGVTYAYRELGPEGGIPVIFFVHLAATLDNWDPRIIDPIAKNRHVIAFDNRGVGASTGQVPDTVEAMLVGISTKAMPIGMTVPIGYLKRWNAAYAGPESAKSYSSIVVDLRDRGMMATFLPFVKSLGLEQEESQAERISLVITIVTALFLLIAFTIMFISAVNISHTFFTKATSS